MAAGISQHPSACCQHFTDGLMCPGVRLQHPRVASPQQPLPPQPEFTQKALPSSHLAAACLSHSWVTSVPAAPTPLLPLHPVLFSPLEKIPLFGNLAIWGHFPLTDPITCWTLGAQGSGEPPTTGPRPKMGLLLLMVQRQHTEPMPGLAKSAQHHHRGLFWILSLKNPIPPFQELKSHPAPAAVAEKPAGATPSPLGEGLKRGMFQKLLSP